MAKETFLYDVNVPNVVSGSTTASSPKSALANVLFREYPKKGAFYWMDTTYDGDVAPQMLLRDIIDGGYLKSYVKLIEQPQVKTEPTPPSKPKQMELGLNDYVINEYANQEAFEHLCNTSLNKGESYTLSVTWPKTSRKITYLADTAENVGQLTVIAETAVSLPETVVELRHYTVWKTNKDAENRRLISAKGSTDVEVNNAQLWRKGNVSMRAITQFRKFADRKLQTAIDFKVERNEISDAVELLKPFMAYRVQALDRHVPHTLAIDFDGVLSTYDPKNWEEVGAPLPGAIDGLWQLQDAGYRIVIFSARAGEPGGKEQIEQWLETNGAPTLEVTMEKVPAEVYLDDNALRFTNWSDNLKQIKEITSEASKHVCVEDNSMLEWNDVKGKWNCPACGDEKSLLHNIGAVFYTLNAGDKVNVKSLGLATRGEAHLLYRATAKEEKALKGNNLWLVRFANGECLPVAEEYLVKIGSSHEAREMAEDIVKNDSNSNTKILSEDTHMKYDLDKVVESVLTDVRKGALPLDVLLISASSKYGLSDGDIDLIMEQVGHLQLTASDEDKQIQLLGEDMINATRDALSEVDAYFSDKNVVPSEDDEQTMVLGYLAENFGWTDELTDEDVISHVKDVTAQIREEDKITNNEGYVAPRWVTSSEDKQLWKEAMEKAGKDSGYVPVLAMFRSKKAETPYNAHKNMGHKVTTHSPDGVNHIEECETCGARFFIPALADEPPVSMSSKKADLSVSPVVNPRPGDEVDVKGRKGVIVAPWELSRRDRAEGKPATDYLKQYNYFKKHSVVSFEDGSLVVVPHKDIRYITKEDEIHPDDLLVEEAECQDYVPTSMPSMTSVPESEYDVVRQQTVADAEGINDSMSVNDTFVSASPELQAHVANVISRIMDKKETFDVIDFEGSAKDRLIDTVSQWILELDEKKLDTIKQLLKRSSHMGWLKKADKDLKPGEWGSKEHQYFHGSDNEGTYHVHYPNTRRNKHRGPVEQCTSPECSDAIKNRKQAGGGAGIRFEDFEFTGTATFDGNFNMVENTLAVDKFRVEDYMNAMGNIDGRLLKIVNVEFKEWAKKDALTEIKSNGIKNPVMILSVNDKDIGVIRGGGYTRSPIEAGEQLELVNVSCTVELYDGEGAQSYTNFNGGVDLTLEFVGDEVKYWYEDLFDSHYPDDDEVREWLKDMREGNDRPNMFTIDGEDDLERARQEMIQQNYEDAVGNYTKASLKEASLDKKAWGIEFVEPEGTKESMEQLMSFLNDEFKKMKVAPMDQMEQRFESLCTDWAEANGYHVDFVNNDAKFTHKTLGRNPKYSVPAMQKTQSLFSLAKRPPMSDMQQVWEGVKDEEDTWYYKKMMEYVADVRSGAYGKVLSEERKSSGWGDGFKEYVFTVLMGETPKEIRVNESGIWEGLPGGGQGNIAMGSKKTAGITEETCVYCGKPGKYDHENDDYGNGDMTCEHEGYLHWNCFDAYHRGEGDYAPPIKESSFVESMKISDKHAILDESLKDVKLDEKQLEIVASIRQDLDQYTPDFLRSMGQFFTYEWDPGSSWEVKEVEGKRQLTRKEVVGDVDKPARVTKHSFKEGQTLKLYSGLMPVDVKITALLGEDRYKVRSSFDGQEVIVDEDELFIPEHGLGQLFQ